MFLDKHFVDTNTVILKNIKYLYVPKKNPHGKLLSRFFTIL